MQYFHPHRCRLGFPSIFLILDTRISQVKGIVRTEEKNVFDRQSTLHAVFTPLFVGSLRGCLYDTGLTFRPEWVSFQSLAPPQVLCFSPRGECETRVTVDEAQGTMGKRKREAKLSSRESVWVRGSSRVKFLLYSHARIERHSLRRVDQTRMRHSLQTINFQCGTKFFFS